MTSIRDLAGRMRRAFLYAKSKALHVFSKDRVSFSVRSVVKGHYQVTYRGVPTQKCPFDYVMYQMLIHEVRPDLIIEIGTNHGGGALYMADLLDIEGAGVVHTIDIEDRTPDLVKAHKRIFRFLGGWQEYDLAHVEGYSNILVIDDGSHMYEDVIGALKKFSPLVSRGSYFIVEDGIVSALGTEASWDGGPLKAIRDFLPQNPQFRNDRRFSHMFGKNATFNVRGYLRREG